MNWEIRKRLVKPMVEYYYDNLDGESDLEAGDKEFVKYSPESMTQGQCMIEDLLDIIEENGFKIIEIEKET